MIQILKRIQPQRQHLTALVVLLLLTFGMTLWLAWAAWDAARDARIQAEDTMEGWAELAADGYKKNVEEMLVGGLVYVFGAPVDTPGASRGHLSLDWFADNIIAVPLCPCLEGNSGVEFFFLYDAVTGTFETKGDLAPGTEFRDWITGYFDAPSAMISRDESRAAIASGSAGGRKWLAPYAVLTDGESNPRWMVGFSADIGTFESVFAGAWTHGQLLPQTPVNDSLLFARVYDPEGTLVFESPVVQDTIYSAQRAFAEPIAGARVTMAVNPDKTDALIIGGVPEPPIGRLAALLAVSTILVLSALLLIRREADLARLRADFIAGVSHELRTPLAQIRMFTETLLLGRVRSEAERTRSLEIIDQEARRLVHLVENVLIFAKSERRKSRINPQLTDLRADLTEAIQGFAVLSRSREIEIRPELQEGVVAPVDRGALRQIVLNLLDNAAKYGPLEQRITVGLALFDDNARLWVDDEGPGVPAEDRDAVFGRFVRLSRDVESPVGGSGIGLAIVRELVLLHGGRVWIADAPGGRGARVVVEIPGAYVRPDAATGGWAVA